MDIKDYLHLYLGCQLQHTSGAIVRLNEIALVKMLTNKYEREEYKLILRQLSDITEIKKIGDGFYHIILTDTTYLILIIK